MFNSETLIRAQLFLIHPQLHNWGFWMLGLGFTAKCFSIHKEIENRDFLMLLQDGSLNFSKFMKDGKLRFLNINQGWYFQKFPNSLKRWKIGIFEVHFLPSFVRFRISISSMVWVQGGARNLWLNCQFSRKKMFIFI